MPASALGRSPDLVAPRAGHVPEHIACPHGLRDRRRREGVKAAGYRVAVALDNVSVHLRADVWVHHVNMPAATGIATFETWTAGPGPRRTMRV